MDYTTIPGTGIPVSQVGLGTWAIGGCLWGGTDEEESVRTVHAGLWGARRPDQLDRLDGVFGWSLTGDELQEIEEILDETVTDPITPAFMAPPARAGA